MTAQHPAGSVSEPDPRVQAWQALAKELTPANSLARIDTATTRVVTNVTVVAAILTGFGLLAAGVSTTSHTVRSLTVTAVATAVFAVGCALTAQILTIHRGLNTNNLEDVKAWYRPQFKRRAYPVRAATFLLLLAILFAGAAAAAALLDPLRTQPTLAVSQIQTPTTSDAAGGNPSYSGATVTVDATFRDLATADTATIVITSTDHRADAVLARATLTPGIDGTATRALTLNNIPSTATINVSATAGQRQCHARLDLARVDPPHVSCGAVG